MALTYRTHLGSFLKPLRKWDFKLNYAKYTICPKLSTDNSYTIDLKWVLYKANLYNTNLNKANLIEADLSNATLIEADLSGANLSGANLSNARLITADLSGANLSGANLNEAKNFTPEQIKRACYWDKAYGYDEGIRNRLKQNKDSDPTEPIDCSIWEREG